MCGRVGAPSASGCSGTAPWSWPWWGCGTGSRLPWRPKRLKWGGTWQLSPVRHHITAHTWETIRDNVCLQIFQTAMGAPVYVTTTSCWGFRSQTSFRRYPIHQSSTQEDSPERGKGTTGRVWVCATTTERWAKTRLSTRYWYYNRVITGCFVSLKWWLKVSFSRIYFYIMTQH